MTALLDRQTYTRRRESGGWNADGEYADGWTTDTVEGSLQPVNGKELQTAEFGERTSATRKLYTDTADWRTSEAGSDQKADQVQYDGDWWEARQLEEWPALLDHVKVYLTRLQEGA